MPEARIRALLQPPIQSTSENIAKGAINSQFRSIDDLGTLDALVVEAQHRYEQLSEELTASQSDVVEFLYQSRRNLQTELGAAQDLSLLRHSLNDELSDLRSGLSSNDDQHGEPTILEDLDTLQRNFKELTSVKQYVQVIEHSLQLSEQTLDTVRKSTSMSLECLQGFKRLHDYVSSIAQGLALLDQKLVLMSLLEKIRDKTWSDIKALVFTDLIAAAEAINWPSPIDYASQPLEKRKIFETSFLKLLKLQNIGKEMKVDVLDEKEGIYAVQALIEPISLRFKYHFDGSRATNRLEKPEWYFTHIQNVSYEHRAFMSEVIQKLLDREDCKHISAWREFTYLLFPLLSRKLRKTIPTLLEFPSLLAHTISETLAFDAAMLEQGFELKATSAAENGETKWEGLIDVILGNAEWFETWLAAEKNFADDQYNNIINDPDAWDVSEETATNGRLRDLRSTVSSRRIKSLMEQVTDRYALLPKAVQKSHFFIAIQIPLLESYHSRIASSLTAFETVSSVFMRAVPGALGFNPREAASQDDPRARTSGTAGSSSLCKALLSASYIEGCLERWEDELSFLQLWADFHSDPILRSRAKQIPLLPSLSDSATPKDTIFHKLVSLYHDIVSRSQDMIVQVVCVEVESEMRAHRVARETLDPDNSDSPISQTLLVPISLLSTHLKFLRSTLSATFFTVLYRRIVKRLAEHIMYHHILYRGLLTLKEGKAIRDQCELWVETCYLSVEGALGGGGGGSVRVRAPWNQVLEASRLVALEKVAWDNITDVTFGPASDIVWEEAVVNAVGISELPRAQVAEILRRRQD